MKNILKVSRITIFYLLILINSFFSLSSQNKLLSEEESINDFKFLCEKIESVHPDSISTSGLEKYKKQIIQELQKGEIAVEDFYILTAPYLASVNDGHSNILPPVTQGRIQYLNDGGLTLPLKIILSNKKFIVDDILTNSATCTISKGDTIISVNGISSDSISNFLYSLVGSEDNNYIKDSLINSMLSTLLWYKYKWGDTFLFEIKKTDGEISTETMKGINQEEALKSLSKKKTPKKENYEFDIDTLTNECKLKIHTFRDPKSLGLFLNKSFEKIKDRNVNNLIIDLRDNGGGSSAAVDSLAFYLTDQPFRLYCKVLLKVSSDVKILYENKYPDIYNKIKEIENGDIYELNMPIIKSNKEYVYKGDLTVLCNEKTYSGASTFVSFVQHMSIGNVVGHTGQDKIYYGDYMTFKLPYSQINFIISMKKFEDC